MENVEIVWRGFNGKNWYELDETTVTDKKILDWVNGARVALDIGRLYAGHKTYYFVYEDVEDAFVAGTQFLHNYTANSHVDSPHLQPYVSHKKMYVLNPDKPFILCEIKTIRNKQLSFPLAYSYEVVFLIKILAEDVVGWIIVDGRENHRLTIKPLNLNQ